MIEKLINFFLVNMAKDSTTTHERVTLIMLGVMNMFGMCAMFFVFVAQLFASSSVDHGMGSNCWVAYLALGLSAGYALLCICQKKALMKQRPLVFASFAYNLLASVLLFMAVRWSVIFVVIMWLMPAYVSLCASVYVSLSLTVLLALGLMVAVIVSGCDVVTAMAFLISMFFSFVITQLFYAMSGYFSKVVKDETDILHAEIDKKKQFISKLSHRIRTPLSNILGLANILNEANGPTKKQLIDSLIASVKTITDIVEVIDEESDRSVSHEVEDEKDEISTFDLSELITQTGEFTQNLEVKLEVYGNLPRLKGNAVKIRRIFLSVFDFFLQNTPKENLPVNVTIVVNRVRIPISPIKYRFDVKSNVSMPLSVDDDIPELTIAKRLIESLNGNIKRRFEDEITCVYFNICFDGEEDLPPVPAQTIEVHTNETTGFTTKAREKSLADADVIVCDDNPINQKVMSLSLEKHVKSITLASNGQECVDLVTRNSFDLVLMDIQMPILDGYGATQQIRQMETNFTNRHIPIIAVTANTLAGDKQHCLSVGMDDYVSKPFQLDDVLAKMRTLVSKYPQG